MIEVYKTNVEMEVQARFIVNWLYQHFPDTRINFDLADCDRILRIEGTRFSPSRVIDLMNEKGFACVVLE